MEDRELMRRKAVEEFMDRWINDPAFLEELQADPKAALQACGIEPNDAMLQAMESADMDTPVEALRERIGKAMTFN